MPTTPPPKQRCVTPLRWLLAREYPHRLATTAEPRSRIELQSDHLLTQAAIRLRLFGATWSQQRVGGNWCSITGPRQRAFADGLGEEKDLVRESFARFADDVVMPQAEHIHRFDTDIPDALIEAAAQMGCFGTCIPEQFGGLMPDDKHDSLGMLVVTEELSTGLSRCCRQLDYPTRNSR